MIYFADNPAPTPPGGGIGGVINGIVGTVSYWSDPWGNTFKALQTAAEGMSKDILPALTSATLPDLTASWFISAYRISFASALFVAVGMLIPQIIRTARGTQAGRELVASIGMYFPIFLLGAMFGPALGYILVNFFDALTNVFVNWGITGSVNSVVDQFNTMISATDPAGITGGVVIACLLMLGMIIALLMVFVVLLVFLVTLYFAGVMFPLGFVWIIDPTKRKFGTKIGLIWIGILASHPLIFFLLGIAFAMMAASTSAFGNNASLQSMVKLVVAMIALFTAALSPLLLRKFAPILPMGAGGTSGPALSASGIGAKNMSDATSQFGGGSSGGDGGGGGGGGGAAAEAEAPMGGDLADAAAGAGASEAAGAAAGGAGAAAGVEGGMVAAGAAESATGVGAAIGVPTIIAAAGVAAAGKGVDLGHQAGQHAANAMDEEGAV